MFLSYFYLVSFFTFFTFIGILKKFFSTFLRLWSVSVVTRDSMAFIGLVVVYTSEPFPVSRSERLCQLRSNADDSLASVGE